MGGGYGAGAPAQKPVQESLYAAPQEPAYSSTAAPVLPPQESLYTSTPVHAPSGGKFAFKFGSKKPAAAAAGSLSTEASPSLQQQPAANPSGGSGGRGGDYLQSTPSPQKPSGAGSPFAKKPPLGGGAVVPGPGGHQHASSASPEGSKAGSGNRRPSAEGRGAGKIGRAGSAAAAAEAAKSDRLRKLEAELEGMGVDDIMTDAFRWVSLLLPYPFVGERAHVSWAHIWMCWLIKNDSTTVILDHTPQIYGLPYSVVHYFGHPR